jgi:hypothetical protein
LKIVRESSMRYRFSISNNATNLSSSFIPSVSIRTSLPDNRPRPVKNFVAVLCLPLC